MLIRYVSDLHLLDKGKKDDFNQEEKFIRFLQDTYGQDGYLRILGDFLDQPDAFTIIYHYKKLLMNIIPERTIFIAGNHDHDMLRVDHLNGLHIYETYVEGNGAVLLHGHQFDKACKHLWVSRIAIKIGNLIEPIYPNVDKLQLQRRKPIYYVTEASNFIANYTGELGSVILFGHTHFAGKWHIKNEEVLNTGTWTNGKSDYIEYRDGIYTVKSFEG